jgi:hypothetical protein
VVIVDANEDVLSKGPLFKRAWADLYPGLVEYQPNSKAIDVDVATRTVKLEFGDVKGDVLNVLPPMKAGNAAAPTAGGARSTGSRTSRRPRAAFTSSGIRCRSHR